MNKKVRTLLYILVVGGLMAAAIILFFITKDLRGTYKANEVEIQTLINNIGEGYETNAQYLKLKGENDAIYDTYQTCATLAYIITILDLVSFGVCLHIADKLKEKEEKDVDSAPIVESKDEERELIKNLGSDSLEPKQEEAQEQH